MPEIHGDSPDFGLTRAWLGVWLRLFGLFLGGVSLPFRMLNGLGPGLLANSDHWRVVDVFWGCIFLAFSGDGLAFLALTPWLIIAVTPWIDLRMARWSVVLVCSAVMALGLATLGFWKGGVLVGYWLLLSSGISTVLGMVLERAIGVVGESSD